MNALAIYKPKVALTPGTPNTATVDLTHTMIGLFHPESYGHRITATLGFDTSRATLKAPDATLEWLLNELLGAHVVVINEANATIWEGFVDTLDFQSENFTFRFGPVMDILNRVRFEYKRVYTGTNPPTTGASVYSPIYEDQVSQERWGIRETVINAGERTESDIAQSAYALLASRRMPTPLTRYATSDNAEPTIALSLLGYGHLLDHALYYYEGENEIALSAKLLSVLNAEPNGIITGANAQIETNAVQVPENDDNYRPASTIITALVQRGNATYDRTIFMVEEGRRVTYATAPSTVGYVIRNVRGATKVSLGWSDAFIDEGLIRAGRWAYIAGALPTMKRSLYEDLQMDARAIFIESLDYDMVRGVQLDGSGRDNLPSRLKDFELGTTAR